MKRLARLQIDPRNDRTVVASVIEVRHIVDTAVSAVKVAGERAADKEVIEP